jgi:acyl-CoA thioester hydrolase
MSDRFCYLLRVRYYECDAQKVVFNSQYGNYIDVAVFEFLRALGFGQTLSEDLDYQLVKQTVEWKSSARFDDVLEIAVWAKHLGNTSFTLATEFRVAPREAVIVAGETVYVLVDGKTLSKTPLPANLRAALERGAPARRTDHSGHAGNEPSKIPSAES